MPTATATEPEVKQISLGEIRFTADLASRPLSLEAVDGYINRWHYGERNVPPMIVDQATFEIIAGRHRFKMYERVLGPDWRTVKVPVIFDPKCPNPDKHPEQFRAYALNLNRDHGVPITAADRRKVLRDLLRSGEKEDKVKAWARRLGESLTNIEVYITDWKHEQEAKAAMDAAAAKTATARGASTTVLTTDDDAPPAEIAEREEGVRGPTSIRADDARSRPRVLGLYLDRVAETLGQVYSLTDAEEKKAIVAVKLLIKKSEAVSRAIATLYR